MSRLARFAPLVLMLAVWPGIASAQTAGESSRGVGVVTTLAGTVTVARGALPAPQPLHLNDDVFVRDHIATAEESVVRVLLGGKALVTVRELSSLTIKEETGRPTIDLSSGKIAMGVVRQRTRPGEVIEIRTPKSPSPRRRCRWRPAQQIFADLRSAPQIAEGPAEFMTTVTTREQAVAVAEFQAPEMTGAGNEGDGGPTAAPGAPGIPAPGVTDAPVMQLVTSSGGAPAGQPRLSYNGQTARSPAASTR